MIFKINNLLFFLFYLIFNPKLLVAIFNGVYIPALIQYQWLKNYDIGTFIDVGSYTGEDSKVINYLFPKAKIIAFEPDTTNYNTIKRNIKIKNFELYKIALSNKKGDSKFYSHPISSLSSQLKMSDDHFINESYMYRETEVCIVKMDTLDNILANKKIKQNVLLKMDTQGTEDLILKGAKQFLKKVNLIHVETCIAHIYKNQSDFSKIYSLLIKNGFIFMGEAKESEFYPLFDLNTCFNSVFIKKNIFRKQK
jgi:FkbM family methyltransferase